MICCATRKLVGTILCKSADGVEDVHFSIAWCSSASTVTMLVAGHHLAGKNLAVSIPLGEALCNECEEELPSNDLQLTAASNLVTPRLRGVDQLTCSVARIS